jgi:CHAD domain-containing protein
LTVDEHDPEQPVGSVGDAPPAEDPAPAGDPRAAPPPSAPEAVVRSPVEPEPATVPFEPEPATMPFDPVPATAPEELPTIVGADDPWAEAGRTILRVQLGRMLAHVDGVVGGEDPEDIHAMRVAARRMRAAWRVFGDGFERDPRRRYVGDLRAVGQRLGVVRDRDVLLEMLDAYERRVGRRETRALEGLRAAWRADRVAGHVVLVAMLRSPAFTAFTDEYQALVGTPGLAARTLEGPAHLRDRLPSRVWAAYETVWAYDEGIDEADIARLHSLRIAGKWLRYTIEFARDALKPESATLIPPIVALQDHIGGMHDQHVAAAEARTWLVGGPGATAAERDAVERFAARTDERAARSRRRFQRTWAPIVASDYRRRLGRALARL